MFLGGAGDDSLWIKLFTIDVLITLFAISFKMIYICLLKKQIITDMKKIKRDGVKKRHPNLSIFLNEDQVVWYQGGYNDAVERANKKIEKLEKKIAQLLENSEALEKKVEELQLGGLTSPEDDWWRYYWNEEKKMYFSKKKVIYEPC